MLDVALAVSQQVNLAMDVLTFQSLYKKHCVSERYQVLKQIHVIPLQHSLSVLGSEDLGNIELINMLGVHSYD